jgi:hypothetical protein
VELTAEQANEMIAGLWAPQFAGEVAKAVAGAQPSDGDLLRLGASLPLTPVRRSFQQLLDAHVKGPPEGLITGESLTDLVRDPGLLLVLKSVPWKNRPRSALPAVGNGFAGGGANFGPGGAVGPPLGGPGAAPGGAKKPANAKGDHKGDGTELWLDATEAVLRSMFARLGAANHKGNAPEYPVKMPRGGVTAEYYLKFPDDLPDSAKQLGVAPLTVHYLRIETNDSGAGTRLSAQVKSKHTHAIQGGYWYENRLSQNGKLSSLDIMVALAGARGSGQGGYPGGAGGGFGAPGGAGRGGAGGKSAQGPQGQFVIDILYVEIEDYK